MSELPSISPAEFAARMKSFADDCDTEAGHCEADGLMCEVLKSLGYGEGVKLFEEMSKWYA